MLAKVGMVPSVPPHPNPLPVGARGLTERVDSYDCSLSATCLPEVLMFDSLAKAGKYLGQAAKLMIGMPDYDNYVEHMRVNHPDQTPMTYEEFFRERQDARYGGKGGARCC